MDDLPEHQGKQQSKEGVSQGDEAEDTQLSVGNTRPSKLALIKVVFIQQNPHCLVAGVFHRSLDLGINLDTPQNTTLVDTTPELCRLLVTVDLTDFEVFFKQGPG